MSSTGQLMLVTGGSGFVSIHCIAQALEQGYRVRTTVRSKDKETKVINALAKLPVDATKVEFRIADLLKDEGWPEALANVALVLHVASPFPATQPADENELIRPAVEGTLRVLRAAKAAGTVKRVVVTSSVAAVAYGTPFAGRPYTESDWSDVEGKGSSITAYAKSKTLAEEAAWKFIKEEGGSMELATVNPAGIFGPPLIIPTESTTCGIIKQMLTGAFPMIPNISFGLVDVRDTAALLLLAATKPEAKGNRYLCVAGKSVSLPEMAGILKQGLGSKASKVSTRAMPNFLVKFLSLFVAQLKTASGEIGVAREFDSSNARALGWSPRSNEEAIVSCGQALLDAGL